MSSGTPLPAPISRPCLAGLMLVGSLLLLTALPSPLEEPGDEAVVQVFAPNETQSDSARDLVRRLERVHYLGLPADDTLSEHVFDNYIDFLDTARSVLLASDYEEFLPWRTTLDNALLEGDLDPAFAMFNRYHSRQIERLAWAVELLKGDLDELPFGSDEELELDRETAPWAQSQEELDTFWRKRLASQIISLQLAGSTLEEAQQKLLERQQEQLRRASQYHERDVFQFFMTALTDAYDPHTRYMVPRLADNFDMAMSLSFEGIGALLRPDGEFALIERIIPGGPAEHDGRLQAGDRILGVAQGKEGPMVDIVGWRLDDAVQLIRGEGGSSVRLSIRPADAPDGAPPKLIELVRDRVKLEDQSASSSLYAVNESEEVTRLDDENSEGDSDEKPLTTEAVVGDLALQIGVVDLPTFYIDTEAANQGDPNFKSSTRDVRRLLEQMTEDGVDGVILDLRGNGGGSLTEAHELAGLLLGSKSVVQVRDAEGRVQVLRGSGKPAWTGPLVILVDRLSASASEIVAAAVQDHRRGLVLGEGTFGKGTVQAVTRAGTGRLLVTVAKFYRITGESTQHAGVTPDINLPPTYDPEEIGESAMDGALEWDVIDSLKLPNRPGESSLIPSSVGDLRARSLARAETDPDLGGLMRELELLREVRADTTLSLDLETRRAEQDAYEARRRENLSKWREAKGYPDPEPEDSTTQDPDDLAIEGAFDLDDDQGASEGDTPPPATPRGTDAWLQEAVRVLAELIALEKEGA